MDDSDDGLTRRARARLGRVLKEKWRLDALLGVGGMAAVYSATHRNGKQVAIKMLHTELSLDDEVRTRFLREGYVANSVGHAGAVSVADDDVADDGSVFLVMDLLEGETVESRWQREGRRLPVAEVLSIADQVLDVLAAAHAKGVVHRDIKPENLFLTTAGQVKVFDFGIARLKELSSLSNATRSGVTLGTPAFMSPEQARGLWDEVDARTDLWAVGATMFTLLTGRYVHEARTPNEQLLAAMTASAPAIATLVEGLPPGASELVDRALAFDRADRWADAAAMQRVLRAAFHGQPAEATHAAPPADPPPSGQSAAVAPPLGPSTDGALARTRVEPAIASPRPRRAPMVGAIGAVVVGAGIVTALVWPSAPDTPASAASGATSVTVPVAQDAASEAGLGDAAAPTITVVPSPPEAKPAPALRAATPAARSSATPRAQGAAAPSAKAKAVAAPIDMLDRRK